MEQAQLRIQIGCGSVEIPLWEMKVRLGRSLLLVFCVDVYVDFRNRKIMSNAEDSDTG